MKMFLLGVVSGAALLLVIAALAAPMVEADGEVPPNTATEYDF